MISIRDFYFSYGKTPVFTGVSTTLTPGHIYGVLGKNGTGKSTLLYNIAGLLYPTSGKITVNGQDPGRREPDFLSDIFMVPEEFYLPNISIPSFVKYYSVFYPKFDRVAFSKYLELFEIPLQSLLQGMSYGQKKKVYISFAVASNTSVLLMDEPTNGLDIISKGQLRKVIASSASDDKILMISSHQVKDLENLIDEVVILSDTTIVLKENLDHVSKRTVV
ncbi:MAG: ATP-binding cassette domain-containing protein [Chryseolinea sp.]